MHIFGSTCFAYIDKKSKLNIKADRGIFLGYDKSSPANLVFFPEKNKIKRIRCVKFTDAFNFKDENPSYEEDEIIFPQIIKRNDETNDCGQSIHADDDDDDADDDNKVERYPKRTRRRPDFFVVDNIKDYQIDYCYSMENAPKSYNEAINSPHSEEWKYAMEREIDALTTNNTYTVVPLPKDKHVISTKWVFTKKTTPTGVEQYKARFVARGFCQIYGLEYFSTFSPTTNLTTIRMLLQIASQYDLNIHQMDVKNAYLNAPIDCEIYITPPEGFIMKNKNSVWRLNKSLYGLKQSAQCWNTVFHDYIIKQQFRQCAVDPCLYTQHKDDKLLILVLWVDDILIASNCDIMLTDVKNKLSERFKMTDLGKISWFLGIEFTQSKGHITMNQSRYIDKILVKFGMEECKKRYTPVENDINKNTHTESEIINNKLYQEIIGSLVYLMVATRPDLCYTVTKLSQKLSRPTMKDLNRAKQVLRYLKGTKEQKLVFKKSKNPLKLEGFSDSDWGNDEDRKSISGYCFRLSENGPIISWKSKKQQIVSLSTCEAEFIAITHTTQEALYLTNILKTILEPELTKSPVVINCDNQASIVLAQNTVINQRSKHIDIKYHFIKNEVKKESIVLKYISSEQNIADVFTKPATRIKLNRFLPNLLGNSTE